MKMKKLLSILLALCMLLSVVPMFSLTASAATTGTCPDCGNPVTWEDRGSEHTAYCQNCANNFGGEYWGWKRHNVGQDSAHCNIGDCANSGGSGNQGGNQQQAGGYTECPGCHQQTAQWMIDSLDTNYHYLTCTNTSCYNCGARIYGHSPYQCTEYGCNATSSQVNNQCTTYDQLKSALESGTNGLDVYVRANITLNGSIVVKGRKNLYLCNNTVTSNGFDLIAVQNISGNQAELSIYGGDSAEAPDEYSRGSLVCPIQYPDESDSEMSYTIYICGGTVNIHSGCVCGIGWDTNCSVGTLNISGGYIDNTDIKVMNDYHFCNTNLTGGYYTIKANPAKGTTDYAADGYGTIIVSYDELKTVNQKVYKFQIVKKIPLISASNLSGQGGVKFYGYYTDSATGQIKMGSEITSVIPGDYYFPQAIDVPGYTATITFDYPVTPDSDGLCATSIQSSITATANYTLKPTYTITCSTCTNGSVSAGKSSTYEGDTVTITPTPNSGYVIDKVYYNDGTQHEITPSSGAYSFTMPGKAVTVSATFAKAKKYVCYIDKNENGTFDGSDVKYESVSDAIEAIGGTENEIGSGVIVLLDNTTDNITVGFYQGITIDLSGKILSAKDTSGTVITNNGTAIVTDTSAIGNGGNITGGAKGIEHSGISLTLKGKANITGNTANIYLPNGSTVDVNNDGADKFTGTVGFTTEATPTAGSPIAVSAQNTADFSGTFLADTTGLILYSCKTSRKGTPSISGTVYYYILNCGVPTVEGKLNSTTTKTYGSVQDAYNDERAEEIKMIADSEENVLFECGDADNLEDTPVILDLNGHILKAADSSMPVITTHNTTTIKDSNPSAKHTEEDLPNGGVIAGGMNGIYVMLNDQSVLNIYGGSIAENYCSNSDGGAGVCLYLGTFNMYGGAICQNTASVGKGGAGVCVKAGTEFNMYGGTISDNVCIKSPGAGVRNDGTFNLYGGKIINNETAKGGLVFLSPHSMVPVFIIAAQ